MPAKALGQKGKQNSGTQFFLRPFLKQKNTIGDGGSTALYTVCTMQIALHCLNSSMYAYIYIVREG